MERQIDNENTLISQQTPDRIQRDLSQRIVLEMQDNTPYFINSETPWVLRHGLRTEQMQAES